LTCGRATSRKSGNWCSGSRVPGLPDIEIRDATAADAAAVAALYSGYVLETAVTFEQTPVSAQDMTGRIAAARERSLPWLVAAESGELTGYAYASPWNPRSAYRHTVEVTAYVARGRTGRGIGSRLYEDLFVRLRALDVHAVVAVIALPNAASVALHEHFGLRRAGVFREVGRKFDRWVDVGYWQTVL
jgi:L-amino acid N-acyltransferase YncA